jgi:hypothetical protein
MVKYLPNIRVYAQWHKQIANSVFKATVCRLKQIMVWRRDADISENFGFIRRQSHAQWLLYSTVWGLGVY